MEKLDRNPDWYADSSLSDIVGQLIEDKFFIILWNDRNWSRIVHIGRFSSFNKQSDSSAFPYGGNTQRRQGEIK